MNEIVTGAGQRPDATGFALPQRDAKPRKKGITSVIDWGPDTFGWGGSATGIRSALECAADYIDFAKIFAPNLLLIPEPALRKAVDCYRDFGVATYAGGILFEYAWLRNQLGPMVELLKRIGLDALEVSENCIVLDRDQRMRTIEYLQRQGLKVIYEYGAKSPCTPMELEDVDAIVADLSALGIDYLTLEQSELDLLAEKRPQDMDELKGREWFSRALIEADPYRFPAQHAQMIEELGSAVNLANVTLGQALRLEGMRRGLGRAVGYSLFASMRDQQRQPGDQGYPGESP